MRNYSSDANDVAAKLEACRSSAFEAIDRSSAVLHQAIERFKRVPAGNDVGRFVSADQGMQIGGENYLAAVGNHTKAGSKPGILSCPLNRVYQPFNPDELLPGARCSVVTEVRKASSARRRHHSQHEILRRPQSGRAECLKFVRSCSEERPDPP